MIQMDRSMIAPRGPMDDIMDYYRTVFPMMQNWMSGMGGQQQNQLSFDANNPWASLIGKYYDEAANQAAQGYQDRMAKLAGIAGENMAQRARMQGLAGVHGTGPVGEWGSRWGQQMSDQMQNYLSNIYSQSAMGKAGALSNLANIFYQHQMRNQPQNYMPQLMGQMLGAGVSAFGGGGRPPNISGMSGYGGTMGGGLSEGASGTASGYYSSPQPAYNPYSLQEEEPYINANAGGYI